MILVPTVWTSRSIDDCAANQQNSVRVSVYLMCEAEFCILFILCKRQGYSPVFFLQQPKIFIWNLDRQVYEEAVSEWIDVFLLESCQVRKSSLVGGKDLNLADQIMMIVFTHQSPF